MNSISPIRDVRHLHQLSSGDSEADDDDQLDVDDGLDGWSQSLDVEVYADSSMTLPGMGERGMNCGDYYSKDFCKLCGKVHAGVSRCQQRGCPDCWDTWTGNRAETIVRRVTAFRYNQVPGIERRGLHVVASPPEGEVTTLADVKRYRKKAQTKLKEAGVRGGVCVFHGFRVKDEVKAVYEELKDAKAVEGGLWQYVREHDRDWRNLTYWSPHYHVIGVAPEFEPDDGDGWVLKRLSTAEPLVTLRDTDAYTSVAKMSRYILSHATFEPDGMQAVTWFGELHSTQFNPEAELEDWELKRLNQESAEAVGDEHYVGEAEGARECTDDECTGDRVMIWDAPQYLGDGEWVDRVGREAERRLAVAFEWAIGEIHPPPGMRRPRSAEEYREAFEEMVERRSQYLD